MLELGADLHLDLGFHHRKLAKCLLSGISSEKWCHKWALWVVGHMRSSKEFTCHRSVASDRAITSAVSQCIANQAPRPGFQHRVCKQFTTLGIPLWSVTSRDK